MNGFVAAKTKVISTYECSNPSTLTFDGTETGTSTYVKFNIEESVFVEKEDIEAVRISANGTTDVVQDGVEAMSNNWQCSNEAFEDVTAKCELTLEGATNDFKRAFYRVTFPIKSVNTVDQINYFNNLYQ